MHDDLGCNNMQTHGVRAILQNYLRDEKGSKRRPFNLIFRLNTFVHDSYQADKIVIQIREWKRSCRHQCVDINQMLKKLLHESSLCCSSLIIVNYCIWSFCCEIFLNIFKYDLFSYVQQIWFLFKAGTHSYKLFPGIINTHNPGQNVWSL